jgi:hypothetical protein
VSLTISQPANGSTVPAGSVMVTLNYQGPQLVPAAQATKLDDYHVHYFLDVDATPYIGTQVPVPTGNPSIVHSGATSQTFDNVAPGQHTVTVLMTGADHISLNPPVVDKVTFTVQ